MRTPSIGVAAFCAVSTILITTLLIRSKQKKKNPEIVQSKKTQPAVPVQAPVIMNAKVLTPIRDTCGIFMPQKIVLLRKYLQQQSVHPVQKFLLTGKTDTTFTCNEGTLVTIAPSWFVNERTGLPINGPVEMNVKEYYDLNDMVMANLTTSTKDAMLETNGMVYISATADGEACRLKKGEAMQISFPVKNNKPGMQLFNGEKDESGTILWKPLKINPTVTNNTMITNEPIEKEGSKDTIVMPADTSLSTLPSFPGGGKAIASSINNIKNYFPINGPSGPVLVDIVIAKTGRVAMVKKIVSCNAGYFDCLRAAIYKMPMWKPALKKGRPIMFTVRMMVLFNTRTTKVLHFMPVYRSPDQTSEIDLNELFANGFKAPESGIGNYYSFATSQLGWMNCDRFINNDSDEPKVRLFVKAETDEPMDVKMIFHNYNSLIAAKYTDQKYEFGVIPLGEPVTIVALKGKAGALQMAVKNMQTSSQPITGFVFKKVIAADIKATMEQFNELFTSIALK